jgi:hypothetical protein
MIRCGFVMVDRAAFVAVTNVSFVFGAQSIKASEQSVDKLLPPIQK